MDKIKALLSNGKQGITYLMVGVGTALLELGLFHLLYEKLGCTVAVSNISATVVATLANFALNRNVTFASTSNVMRSLVLYILLFVFNSTFSTIMISLLISLGVPATAAKFFMQCCVVLWNFVIYRRYIFV